MTEVRDLIREVNDAVERKDFEAISQQLHPEAVWRHNIGLGTIEEGEYVGRDSVIALFRRIVEPWERMCPRVLEMRDVTDHAVMIKGELRVKHGAMATEIVTPYEQLVEVRSGLLFRGEMVTGADAHIAEPQSRSDRPQ